MKDDDHPLTHEEFWQIYRRVPRLCVELVIMLPDRGVLLSQRAIEPFVGSWHLPGGTVRFGERLIDAVKRVGLRELGIQVGATANRGFIEYPSHVRAGLDTPVGLLFEVLTFRGTPRANHEASKLSWFATGADMPPNTHVDQQPFLSRYLRPRKEN